MQRLFMIFIALLLLLLLSLVWTEYQQEYVCKPIIVRTIEVRLQEAFSNRTRPPGFVIDKSDWLAPWDAAYIQILLDTGERCFLTLVAEDSQLIGCQGIQYRITGFSCTSEKSMSRTIRSRVV